ncbi:MAG: Two-component system response regulator [Frankiales bacterium]|nr:Two-component system response regulator [Frankiales bacterium]
MIKAHGPALIATPPAGAHVRIRSDSRAGQANVRVVVATANILLRAGICALLGETPGLQFVSEHADGSDVSALAARPGIDLVVLDHAVLAAAQALPIRGQRFAAIVLLAGPGDSAQPAGPDRLHADATLVHGQYSTEDFIRTLLAAVPRSGARPVPVSSNEFRMRSLSPREREVMDHVSRGCRNGEIAAALWLSEKTVKNHINRIFSKLGVDTRAQAIVLWLTSPTPDEQPTRRAS